MRPQLKESATMNPRMKSATIRLLILTASGSLAVMLNSIAAGIWMASTMILFYYWWGNPNEARFSTYLLTQRAHYVLNMRAIKYADAVRFPTHTPARRPVSFGLQVELINNHRRKSQQTRVPNVINQTL